VILFSLRILSEIFFILRIIQQETIINIFFHGSAHLGNAYVRFNVQLDTHGFVCTLYFTIFAVHDSGVICTHHQEHKLQSTAIGIRNGYGM
jgi:hypothetical protein